MSKVFTLTEAASIGLHSIVLIAENNNLTNVNFLAEKMGFSKHHVAKVLQRLVKEGYLRSVRGPSGGFRLVKEPNEITLLEIYEAIESKLVVSKCPMDYDICNFDKCILGDVVQDMTLQFKNYLQGKTIDDFVSK